MSDHILLVPFDRKFLETYRDWVNDPEVGAGMDRVLPVTATEHEAWYNGIVSNRDAVVFAIALADCTYIGNVWLWDINWRHRKAEARILLGRDRGKGHGTEALRALVDFAFCKLNLVRVYAYVLANNEASVRAFSKAEFKVEGTLCSDRFVGDSYRDVLVMARLKRSAT